MIQGAELKDKLSTERLQKRALELLWVALTLSILGRGWLHFTKDQPYWSFFWSEELLSPLLALVGVEWSDYVESASVESALHIIISGLGGLYLALGLYLARYTASIFNSGEWPRPSQALRRALWLLLGLQLMYVGTYWFGRSLYLSIWLEQSTLTALPWLCLAAGLSPVGSTSTKVPVGLYLSRAPITVTRLVISCTFIGHGTFALGLYPVPEDYMIMVMRTFGCTQQTAITLLWWAGALDVLAALAVWTPRRYLRVRWSALAYMLIWGGITAFARVVGHWGLGTISQTVWHWLPELMLRLPHAFIPWWLLTLEGGVRPTARWSAHVRAISDEVPSNE